MPTIAGPKSTSSYNGAGPPLEPAELPSCPDCAEAPPPNVVPADADALADPLDDEEELEDEELNIDDKARCVPGFVAKAARLPPAAPEPPDVPALPPAPPDSLKAFAPALVEELSWLSESPGCVGSSVALELAELLC